MSRSISGDAATAIQGRRVALGLFAEFEFSGGTVRVWSGRGPKVANGLNYTGVGSFGRVSPVEESGDITPRRVSFELSGVPSAMIASVLAENYRGRRCRLYLGFVDYSDIDDSSFPVSVQSSAGVFDTIYAFQLVDTITLPADDRTTIVYWASGGNLPAATYLIRYTNGAVGTTGISWVSVAQANLYAPGQDQLLELLGWGPGSPYGHHPNQASVESLEANRQIWLGTTSGEGPIGIQQQDDPVTDNVDGSPNTQLELYRVDAVNATGVSTVLLFAGRMDTAQIQDTGSQSKVIINAESRLVDLARPRRRALSHDEQTRRFSGDVGLEYVSKLSERPIYWGGPGPAGVPGYGE